MLSAQQNCYFSRLRLQDCTTNNVHLFCSTLFILSGVLICLSHEGSTSHGYTGSWVHMRVHIYTDFETSAYLDRLKPLSVVFEGIFSHHSRLQDGLPPCLPVVHDPPLLVLHGVLHQRLQLNSSSTGHWYCNHFDKDANLMQMMCGECVLSSWLYSAYISFVSWV